LIDHLLTAWQASRVGRIIVVARSDDDKLLAHLQGRGLDLVVPPLAPPEMKDSVAAALVHIRSHYQPRPEDLWLLAPADLPQLNPHVIDQVLDAAMSAAGAIVVPQAGPRRGHPVAFPWSLHEEVGRLGPNQGVNALLRGEHPVQVVEVSALEGWIDIDRPEDYRRLRSLDDEPRA
jgi:CTP:molybdopterin cytidylyltransferase MocA